MEKQVTPSLFRTYALPKYTSTTTENAKIWEAARATTAAPPFFAPIRIGALGSTFADGGLRNNNPIQALKIEARKIWPSEQEFPFGVFVSIGTGEQVPEDLGPGIGPLAKALGSIATDSRKRSIEFKVNNPDLQKSDRLFRFNVSHGMEKVGLENWQMKATMESATERYLNEDDGEVSDKMERCAIRVAEKALAAELSPSDDALVARFDQLRGTSTPAAEVVDVDVIPATENGDR